MMVDNFERGISLHGGVPAPWRAFSELAGAETKVMLIPNRNQENIGGKT